ncbi:MAG: hypothetical protein BJ554DRAFT_6055 [Olpidium bornovanus]|uniref:Uncharacterized protein n=1 Tax=Olpidium bornovanus TaxID=278681 RepID=A0A8H8A240_9FUNG|nr:MAG: hypothetical protein BJ554DRAFT_6055 [Olpidium bornovanus]
MPKFLQRPFHERMAETRRRRAVKDIEKEMKDEKKAKEDARKQALKERREKAAEKELLSEAATAAETERAEVEAEKRYEEEWRSFVVADGMASFCAKTTGLAGLLLIPRRLSTR